ncbi:MAG: nuclear transport factor 2 family protein [Rhodothermales bacterium]
MRRSAILWLLLFALQGSGCTLRMRQPDEAERNALRETVLSLTREILDAAEQVDVEAAFRYHSALPDAVFLIDGKRYTRRELIEAYQSIYAGVESQDIDFGEPTVTVVSEHMIVVSSTGRFVTRMKSGGSFARDAAWTYVWVNEGETWNIRHVHQSFPRPD